MRVSNAACIVAFLIASSAIAAETWTTRETDDMSIAVTANMDGDAFGLRCDAETAYCEWAITTKSSCKENASSPAVMSGPKGASHIFYNCRGATKSGKSFVYVLSPYDNVEELVLAGGIVSMAFPLESGRFSVNRFDTSGAKTAIESVQKSVLTRKGKSTRGETL